MMCSMYNGDVAMERGLENLQNMPQVLSHKCRNAPTHGTPRVSSRIVQPFEFDEVSSEQVAEFKKEVESNLLDFFFVKRFGACSHVSSYIVLYSYIVRVHMELGSPLEQKAKPLDAQDHALNFGR